MSTVIHINERTLEQVQGYFSTCHADLEILSDGDCGSVWGEAPDGTACRPHVLIVDPIATDRLTLARFQIPWVETDFDDWSEVADKSDEWEETDDCQSPTH